MTTRVVGLIQAAAGALLWGAAALVTARAPVQASLAPSGPARSVASERPPSGPAQSLRDSEPPLLVGPAYDGDLAMPAHAKTIASYTLSAHLDAGAHTVAGSGTLVWENASSRPAPELYFHLYLNAFKNSRTVFLRSPFGGGRSGHGARKWGYIDVKRLAVREMEGADLWPTRALHTDDDPDDETDIRVPLPRAVQPGERITVELEWTSQLPEIVERTGYVRGFHMLGQWFPKIARREPDGAWVHFPFHAESEFYADFGSYDVTLDVPESMILGATGVRVSEDVKDKRRRARYRIDDVHDFAWTAWDGFLATRRETKATRGQPFGQWRTGSAISAAHSADTRTRCSRSCIHRCGLRRPREWSIRRSSRPDFLGTRTSFRASSSG